MLRPGQKVRRNALPAREKDEPGLTRTFQPLFGGLLRAEFSLFCGLRHSLTEGSWPKELQKIILRGAKPQRKRPGAYLPKVDLFEIAAAVEKKVGCQPRHGVRNAAQRSMRALVLCSLAVLSGLREPLCCAPAAHRFQA